MKMRASQIERMLAKAEAALAPPERKCLRAIVHEGDDEAAAMEKALAEHAASHPEDAGRTVQDWPAPARNAGNAGRGGPGAGCGVRRC
jgi:hypothetical protein